MEFRKRYRKRWTVKKESISVQFSCNQTWLLLWKLTGYEVNLTLLTVNAVCNPVNKGSS